jgi:dinuclear metal center YbgI/SA1388 family protein
MQLKQWMECMEKVAPAALAEDWDNHGLLISPERNEVHHVLIDLDCTMKTVEEAKKVGAELVLVHHPLFFSPVKHILTDDPQTSVAWKLIREGIGLFAAHTNLDRAAGGVNDVLAESLGIRSASAYGDGTGRIGDLDEPVSLIEFARKAETALKTVVSFTGDPDRKVQRIAVLGGAGGSMLPEAKEACADAYLTGEAKHHEAIAAEEWGIALLVAGHDETERIVLPALRERLQSMTDDVKYTLALSGRSPFRRGTGGTTHEQ